MRHAWAAYLKSMGYIVKEVNTALRNRLHSLLYQQYPNYREFFYAPFSKTAMAFWERFPSGRQDSLYHLRANAAGFHRP